MSLFGSNKLTEAGPVHVYGIGFLKLQANNTTIGEEDMTDFKPETVQNMMEKGSLRTYLMINVVTKESSGISVVHRTTQDTKGLELISGIPLSLQVTILSGGMHMYVWV